MTMTRTRLELAAIIDHTLLKPETTAAEIGAFCDQAVDLKVYGVCISPTMVGVAAERLRGSGVKVVAVIGFPSGTHRPEVKADEAAWAAADGADEADMVINLGLVLGGEWDRATADIVAVRTALTGGQILKVIIDLLCLPRRGGRRCRFRQVLHRVPSGRGRHGRSHRDHVRGGCRTARGQSGWRHP
jgi:deoxyribose-phosphate aldolase